MGSPLFVIWYELLTLFNRFLIFLTDLDISEVCIRFMKKSNYSPYNWLMLEMQSCGFDACIDLNQWEQAYEYGRKCLEGQKYVFS